MKRLAVFILLFFSVALFGDNTAYYKSLIVGKIAVDDAATIESGIGKLTGQMMMHANLLRMCFSQDVFRITGETNGVPVFSAVDKLFLVIPEFRGYKIEKIYDLASVSNLFFVANDRSGFYTNTDAVCRIADGSSYAYVIFEMAKNRNYTIKAFYFGEEATPKE